MKFENAIFVFCLATCLAGCVGSTGTTHFLDRVETQMETSPDSAFVALDSLDRSLLNTKELRARHALLYSIALDKCGIGVASDSIINIAVEYYSSNGDERNKERALYYKGLIQRNAATVQKDTLARQGGRIIEERYADKQRLVDKKRSTRALLTAIIICLAALAGLFRMFGNTRRKLDGKPDDEAMEIIEERMSVLDKLLASKLSSDDRLAKVAEDDLDKLVSDKDTFLHSTTVLFRSRHPDFISYLEGGGLTGWEVGYCCLYALGLKGKDVGEYIQKKRHYIIASEVRRKLGLSEHDNNLGIWLRSRLAELENSSKTASKPAM